ncbi:signal peptidase I [Bacillus cereus]|uniref:signal peptidase I n=1 Tax=Bacillota TaxID=1239 RepID=UPI002149A60B|nr:MULTISPECIES: signal peptidase I [Bacillota]MCR1952225.1 signal peptidase I [Clostridium sp. DSM 100503]MCR2013792.1 signal peptidase I [Bacillus cereus]
MNKKFKCFFKDWGIPIVSAIIIAVLINKFLIFKVYIPSESMAPTINKDDRLIISRIYNPDSIKRGDILVFESKELQETLVKRVIGLPGDSITISEGIVTINGEILEEEYVKNNSFEYKGEFTVPSEKYLFLGDNRSNSNDSRFWINPYIDFNDIEGKATIRIYPFKYFGRLDM